MDSLRQIHIESTMALANKAPVMEAVYSIDEKSTLRLYDCLVPKM